MIITVKRPVKEAKGSRTQDIEFSRDFSNMRDDNINLTEQAAITALAKLKTVKFEGVKYHNITDPLIERKHKDGFPYAVFRSEPLK